MGSVCIMEEEHKTMYAFPIGLVDVRAHKGTPAQALKGLLGMLEDGEDWERG